MRSRSTSVLISAALLVGASAAVAFAPPATAVQCTDNWIGPNTGTQQWTTAGNWSDGVPDTTDDVCIVKSGTYTVQISAGATVHSVKVGGTTRTQTLLVLGSTLNLATATTSTIGKHGVLSVTSSATDSASVSGGTIVNNGRVGLSSGAGTNPVYLRSNLTNLTGGSVGATFDTRQDNRTTTTNSGSFVVRGTYAISGGGNFAQMADHVSNAGADGKITQKGGTFTAAGGYSEAPVTITEGTLVGGSMGGTITVHGSTTLSGGVPDGQSLTVDASTTSATLSLSGANMVRGDLRLQPNKTASAAVAGGAITVVAGGAFRTQGPNNAKPAYLRAPLSVQSGGAAYFFAPSTVQDAGTTTTNNGLASLIYDSILEFTPQLSMTGGSAFVNGAAATLAMAVNGDTHAVTMLTGGAVTVNGTLAVSAFPRPQVGDVFVPLPGPATGRFSAYSFGGYGYSVSYPAGQVVLTAAGVAAAPRIHTINPTSGPTSGGNRVVITGKDLSDASSATFGGVPATNLTVINDRKITVTAPAATTGTVDVRVTTTGGTSDISAAARYTYVLAPTVTNLSPSSRAAAGGAVSAADPASRFRFQ